MNDFYYRKLKVYHQSKQLVAEVYRITHHFPPQEQYGLTNQIQRAVISIPSNIAEGNARQSTKEYSYFLSVARGSIAELETQLILGERNGYWESKDVESAFDLITEIRKMLTKIKHNLVNKD